MGGITRFSGRARVMLTYRRLSTDSTTSNTASVTLHNLALLQLNTPFVAPNLPFVG